MVAGEQTEQTLTVQIDVVDDVNLSEAKSDSSNSFALDATHSPNNGNPTIDATIPPTIDPTVAPNGAIDFYGADSAESDNYPQLPQVKNSIEINKEGNKEFV